MTAAGIICVATSLPVGLTLLTEALILVAQGRSLLAIIGLAGGLGMLALGAHTTVQEKGPL